MFKLVSVLTLLAGTALAQEAGPAATATAVVAGATTITLGDSAWDVRRVSTNAGTLSIVQNRGSQPLTLWDEAGGLAVSLPPESAVSLPCTAGEVSGNYQLTDAVGFNAVLAIACGETVVLKPAG
jgi:hypothetical protein